MIEIYKRTRWDIFHNFLDVHVNENKYSNTDANLLFEVACHYVVDEAFTRLTPSNLMSMYGKKVFKKMYKKYSNMLKDDDKHPAIRYLDYMKQFTE
jgi:hypothetical protein